MRFQTGEWKHGYFDGKKEKNYCSQANVVKWELIEWWWFIFFYVYKIVLKNAYEENKRIANVIQDTSMDLNSKRQI